MKRSYSETNAPLFPFALVVIALLSIIGLRMIGGGVDVMLHLQIYALAFFGLVSVLAFGLTSITERRWLKQYLLFLSFCICALPWLGILDFHQWNSDEIALSILFGSSSIFSATHVLLNIQGVSPVR